MREIGRGGMGVVYHAIDERLERAVAIKTLPPHLANDATVRARFLREARTAGSLSHPNIVPIYQGAEHDGVVYFVMGLVDGESLAERIARDGPLTTGALMPMVRQLAEALAYAHAQGVVHRDIKAENVLIDRRGHAMVTDFGIARVTEAQPMTATGTVLGTVHYMSPEQVQGDELDGRSDLYALGVLMFYALSGRFPFERATAPAVLVAHVNATPPFLRELVPGVDGAIDRMVSRLLAKVPASRYASAGALLEEVLAWLQMPMSPIRLGVSPEAMPAPEGRPSTRMASADAQQVWARAAELQADTSAQARPANFSEPAELLTRGYAADEVRAAAVDAGIDERFVNRALVERQAAAAAAVAVKPGDAMLAPVNAFLGAPTKIEYTAVIDRELRPEEFEDVADELRAAIGQLVTVSAVGRTLTVNTTPTPGKGMPRTLQVTVSSRNGRTTIRAFEDTSQIAGGLFGGLAGGAGVGGGTAIAAIVGAASHNPPQIVLALLGSMALSVTGARWLFMRSSQKKQAELERIVRRVGERILSPPRG
ncbi:MAG: serine/threonine protein kinase [Gemmatimonadaceae bacterium]|nr:serine/threonine protein kinase [Gemmatimonadaceae bacterium]